MHRLLLPAFLMLSSSANALDRAEGKQAFIGHVRFGGPLQAAMGGHWQFWDSLFPQYFLSPTIGVNGYTMMAGVGAAGSIEGPTQLLAPLGLGLHCGYLHLNKLSRLDGKPAVWLRKDSASAHDFFGLKMTAAYGLAVEFSSYWSTEDTTVIHSLALGFGF